MPTQAPSSTDTPRQRGNPRMIAEFHADGQSIYRATLKSSVPNTLFERLQRVILGRPIPETLAGRERLNRARALAILSSDALSSVAYATEASLAVLLTAGIAALTNNLGIGLVTAALMLIVGSSYRQTIHAYPSGGGSYIVAKDNLGTLLGLIAAASLLVDYLLTVSVSISSGIDAIASAIPALVPLKLGIEVGALIFIVLINLRGIRQSGMIFAVPTYVFLVSFGLMIVFGIVEALLNGGLITAAHPAASSLPAPTESLTPLLILTAFSAGCSAMTGVEAISNGVPAFEGASKEEQSRHAAQTLIVMIALLATFFLGTVYLAWRIGAVPYPNSDPTVDSQIARFVFHGATGWLFYVVQAATLLILVLAANTSFADFPRLLSILARDAFVPDLFAYRGERVAFNAGILALGALSAAVLLVFRGNVVALINLYALGVFTAFTLSQSGMVVHWLRHKNEHGWLGRLITNGFGAFATGVVMLVIAITKFDRGAWMVVILIPLLVLGFLGIHVYYRLPRIAQLDEVPQVTGDVVIVPIFTHQDVPVQTLSAQTHQESATAGQPAQPRKLVQEIERAASIAPRILLVRVVPDRHEAEQFCATWKAYLEKSEPALNNRIDVEAVISPYRTMVLPLANFIAWRRQHDLAGKKIVVLLPREEHPRWWEAPLQRHMAARVRQALAKQHGDIAVVDLPYVVGRGKAA
jgi:amino acid transporter